MAKPYSLDLRERVADAVLSGRSCRKVTATFDVSVASAVMASDAIGGLSPPDGSLSGRGVTRPGL
jgi:hypothetical protein